MGRERGFGLDSFFLASSALKEVETRIEDFFIVLDNLTTILVNAIKEGH